MTDTIETAPAPAVRTPPLFVVSVFTSAALVFMVQPMVAKLVLPLLGGSPAVWNTSMAFFQIALLVGYGYAHFLQKIPRVRQQITVHIAALVVAGLTLFPLSISKLAGDPSSNHPALWLLAVLALSIGLPFAILSATAPLVQAWHARVFRGEGSSEPYSLYAASNLGSLLALLAYPIVMEPLLTLHTQRWTWSSGYWVFVLILASLAVMVWKRSEIAAGESPAAPVDTTPAPTWRQRAIWVALAAIPSSLMLGVTAHLATDVASAPFLWVVPLALYLLTFIVAFQTRPVIPQSGALLFQAAAVAACAATLEFAGRGIEVQLFLHLSCFFLTALICHQALVARRPDPSHLTEFYLCMSLGGVVGGSFNAFLAPVIFNSVVEYPLLLAISCLARPSTKGPLPFWQAALTGVGMLSALLAVAASAHYGPTLPVKMALAATTVAVFMLRDRAMLMFGLMAVLLVSAHVVGAPSDVLGTRRSFFGVLRESQVMIPGLGGETRVLTHGTTLHGAQAVDPRFHCRPLVYYAPETPIGQVFTAAQAMQPALRIGAVGLGTGSVAAYVRPADHLTFFEIDPLVIKTSGPGGTFTYTSQCAKGPVDFVLGDARLTLANQPKAVFDVLLIDAFSSDAVPAHLLTVEALKGYLTHLKPDGVLLLHLSNRNLELNGPATAVAKAAGGYALLQKYSQGCRSPQYWESGEDVLIVGRSAAALAPFEADPRWVRATTTVAPWTDNYTNLVGALINRLKQRMGPDSQGRACRAEG